MFADYARLFYSSHEQACGYTRLKDRFGQEHDLPLLRVSASIIEIPKDKIISSTETLSELFSQMKEQAKTSKVCAASLL